MQNCPNSSYEGIAESADMEIENAEMANEPQSTAAAGSDARDAGPEVGRRMHPWSIIGVNAPEAPAKQLTHESIGDGDAAILLTENMDSQSRKIVYEETGKRFDKFQDCCLHASHVRWIAGSLINLLSRNEYRPQNDAIIRSNCPLISNIGLDLKLTADEEDDDVSMSDFENDSDTEIGIDLHDGIRYLYLGSNVDHISNVTYLNVGQTYRLMLFWHDEVLFPGEGITFVGGQTNTELYLNEPNGSIFGLCFMSDNLRAELIYGVICQIYEKGIALPYNTVIQSCILQRFVTKRSKLSRDLEYITLEPQSEAYGVVKILPEIYMPDQLEMQQTGSMNRFRDIKSMQNWHQRFQAATTGWPSHVYNNYTMEDVISKVRGRFTEQKASTMPTDPARLSFWLARNLHLPAQNLLDIFSTDSVNARYKMMCNTIENDEKSGIQSSSSSTTSFMQAMVSHQFPFASSTSPN